MATDQTRETTREVNMQGAKLLSGFASLLGAWIALMPFLLREEAMVLDAAAWNYIIVGAAIFLVAGYNYYRVGQLLPIGVGAAVFTALLGLWVLITPFVVFAAETDAVLWSAVVSGALVTLIGLYDAYKGRQAGATTGTMTT